MATKNAKVEDQNEKSTTQTDENEGLSFLEEHAGEGTEGIQSTIPFLKQLAGDSPELVEGSSKYLPNAKAGDFVHATTNQVLGKKLKVIPVKFLPIWQKWTPGDEKGNNKEFRGRFIPNSIPVVGDPFKDAHTADGCVIKNAYEIYALLADHLELGLVCISLSPAKIKDGNAFASLVLTKKLASGKPIPVWGAVWQITSVYQESKDAAKKSYWTICKAKEPATLPAYQRFVTKEEYDDYIKGAVDLMQAFVEDLAVHGQSNQPAGITGTSPVLIEGAKEEAQAF
jgi:hypothetical protein